MKQSMLIYPSGRKWQMDPALVGTFPPPQMTYGKSFDGFCPLGPCIVSADVRVKHTQRCCKCQIKYLTDGFRFSRTPTPSPSAPRSTANFVSRATHLNSISRSPP